MSQRTATQMRQQPHNAIQPVCGLLQRKCAGCGSHTIAGGECSACVEKKGSLRRKHGNMEGANEVPQVVHEVLRSSGRPLDSVTRAFMEPRFRHDFSRVRVHTGTRAAESASAVSAVAYTVGNDVVFGSGQYNPTSHDGRRLLAHELTHVTQNSSAFAKSSNATLVVGDSADSSEHEADWAAEQIASEHNVDASPRSTKGPVAGIIQRQSAEPSDGTAGCAIGSGITNSTCGAYAANAWWLPSAYVNNATCACMETPNVPTAKCVRKVLQDRMAATPAWFKMHAASEKPLELLNPPAYQLFVQTFLTPRIYRDHVTAYASCCCPSGPAAYPSWVGVTTVPLPCPLVGASIRLFGSCHGTPGTW